MGSAPSHSATVTGSASKVNTQAASFPVIAMNRMVPVVRATWNRMSGTSAQVRRL